MTLTFDLVSVTSKGEYTWLLQTILLFYFSKILKDSPFTKIKCRQAT